MMRYGAYMMSSDGAPRAEAAAPTVVPLGAVGGQPGKYPVRAGRCR
jgi:hypothetical protein